MLVRHNLQYAALVLQHKERIGHDEALSRLHREIETLRQEYREALKPREEKKDG